MELATAVDLALRAAGVPVVGVSPGKVLEDKSTWRVYLAPDATPEQAALAAQVFADFDLQTDMTPVVATKEAKDLATSRQIRAFWLANYRLTHGGKDPTPEESAMAHAVFVQAYLDTAEQP